ncbi:MAG: hypothetical protein IJO53_08830 [Clostridia bacterium]|nr:hypothetical protein [Clostridia bacterium]
MDRPRNRPSGTRNAHNTFERTRPQPGRRSGTYSRNVSSPKAMQEEKKRLYLLIALLVVLPPIGIVCLWRGGFLRFPYRVAASVAAFFLMVLYFSWMLPEKTVSTISPEIRRPSAITQYSPSSSMYADESGTN